MAVTYVTGAQRSGKSYFSVYRIFNLYKKDNEFIRLREANTLIQTIKCWYYYFRPLPLKKTYTHTYTNIDEFDFDYAPQLAPLVWDDFYRKLDRLHKLYMKDVSDAELNVLSKKLGLYDALFVVDEAHNYLRKIDDVILWWITYHGHMHQDIHLISHNMKQIASEYKDNAIYYYRVASPLKAVSDKHFKIGSYETHAFYAKDHIKNIFVPIKDEVFGLYHSGQKQERKNTFKKFLYIIPILIAFLIIFSSFMLSSFNESDSIVPSEDNITITEDEGEYTLITDEDGQVDYEPIDDIEESSPGSVDYSELVLVKISCIDFICNYKDTDFPLTFLRFHIEHSQPQYYDIDKKTASMTDYTLLVDESLVRLLIGQDEKQQTQRSNHVTQSTNTDPFANTLFNR